jgi:hypothetical protein
MQRSASTSSFSLLQPHVQCDCWRTQENPGIVVSIATAGDLVQWHPHLLRTEGGKTAEGSRKPLLEWDGLLLMRLFRERLPARLVESHADDPTALSRRQEISDARGH